MRGSPSFNFSCRSALVVALLLMLAAGQMRTVASAAQPSNPSEDEPHISLYEGSLGACKIAIASPEGPKAGLVLYARGYRPPEAPLDIAIDVRNPFYRDLLKSGWVIAVSSFRRNGWIVDDAILDLRELREFVVSKHAAIKRVILIGSSMGGYIGAKVAEKPDGLADAVLALGAGGFPVNEVEHAREFSRKPQIPTMFLSNVGEIDGPRFYAQGAPAGSVAVWTVGRPGHVNLNSSEKRAAMDALLQWLDGVTPELERDATAPPNPGPSRARFSGDAAEAPVDRIGSAYGHLETAFIAEDLQKLGLKPGERFQVEANGVVLELLWGTVYGDVPKGEGIAFLTGEGVLRIARNHANVAALLGVREGDKVTIRR